MVDGELGLTFCLDEDAALATALGTTAGDAGGEKDGLGSFAGESGSTDGPMRDQVQALLGEGGSWRRRG